MNTHHYKTVLFGILLMSALSSCMQNLEPVYKDDTQYKIPSKNSFLPVDLQGFFLQNANGRMHNTKSSQTEELIIPPIDSILDWSRAVQKNYSNRKVYTQIPVIDSLYSGCSAAIAEHIENIRDSIVSMKIFLIEYEDCNISKKKRYFATMIPTPLQTKLRPDYSFLHKPNFSGIIIYSDTTGKYISSDFLENGLVRSGKILSPDSTSTSADYEYTAYFALCGQSSGPITRSGADEDDVAWEDELYGICIIAVVEPENKKLPYPTSGTDGKTETFLTEKEGKEGGGLGNGLLDDTDSEQNNVLYTLNVRGAGCCPLHFISTNSYTEGSKVSLKAKPGTDSCIFYCWTDGGYIVGNLPYLTVTMDKSYTITVNYVSSQTNPECFAIAKIATDSILMANISSIKEKTLREDIEYGFLTRNDNTQYNVKGTKKTLSFKLEQEFKYSAHFHSHTLDSSSVFPSHSDLLTIRKMVVKNKMVNVNNFKYGITHDNKILVLRVTDAEKLIRYFNSITNNSNLLNDKFEEKYQEVFISPAKKPGVSYDDSLLLFANIAAEMGLSVTAYGEKFPNIYDTTSIKWKSLNPSLQSETTNFILNECI